MDDQEWADHAHEETLQALVRHLLTADDLDQLCDDAGIPALVDAGGTPVSITNAHTYRDAGVLTLDGGVLLELSDGSQFGLTVSISRRPHGEVTLRPASARPHPGRPPSAGPGRAPARRAAGSCGCVCSSGGFCGGCGHAGCGRR